MKNRNAHHSHPRYGSLLMLHVGAAMQRDRLRRHSDSVALLLASLAGLREHEIRNLRWAEIDLDARTIRITASKGRELIVSLPPPLALLLGRLRTLTPDRQWLFSNGERPPSPGFFQTLLRRAWTQTNAIDPSIRIEPVSFLALRRLHAAGLGTRIARTVFMVIGVPAT